MLSDKNVKLEDVAKLAGVSKTTVSRVLNHRGYLSQKTIDKVHEAIDNLNYRPNQIARQLHERKTNLVGLVFPTMNDPFFSQLETKLDSQLYKLGYKTLLGNSQNDPDREQNYLQQLLNHQIDGLIVGSHNKGLTEYNNLNLPIISIERHIADHIPVVASDNYLGGKLATQQLIDDGCKHIIHTNYPELIASTNQLRQNAYVDVMHKNNLPVTIYHIDFDSSLEDKISIIHQLFIEHPEVDGIFADNDTNANLIMQTAKKLGYKIPEDLKIVGFDGSKMVQMFLPELTTIQQSIDQMAEVAVELLEQRIEGNTEVKSVTLPVKLIKGSTA
ncbi:LacI family DNA-binding transcriptional regulator [Lentilactobacillus laojiaonis]|uniref:LacI family DNA-binding transcriptional regulator n=1 Tax=Lentilactobacillus laojiaonis TaxID=2883998 RepID=UPI001D0A61B2|nr:LacI family DNA-binding transcriptional regulator [Lentilactobacillus laojiaonis]UDM32690.1 LacI family DNA-binding transcriptional regulator [Lentilactobacillus laojiaonis]